MIDYENIRDKSKEAYRYLGFGRFAGIIGTYNTLNLYLKLHNKQTLPRAFEINNYEKIKNRRSSNSRQKRRGGSPWSVRGAAGGLQAGGDA